jgi:hypothetical protein
MTRGSFLSAASPQPKENIPESQLTQLMRDLGATRWDPTPVDQHDYFLDEIPGESALQRALAWMRAHTIRRGRWKAYAVDEKGQELSIERLAADLGWKVKWAQEVWRVGEGHGLFRRDKQFPSRLYLSGKVTRRTSKLESDGCGKFSRCTPVSSSFALPSYLDRQMANWEPERRAAVVLRMQRQHRWKELVMRDGVAALREITEQHDDSLLRDLGLEKRHRTKRREPQQTVRVLLLADPESQVDNSEPDVVQPPHSAVQTLSPSDSPVVVQGGLHEGNRSSVCRSEADVHRRQHGVQVAVGEVDEAAEGAPSLKSLETTRGKEDPSSSFSEPNVNESERSTTTTRPAFSSSSAQPETPGAEPAAMPNEEFSARMTRIFVDNGKDNPNSNQIRYVMENLPDHPWARREFLFTLQNKIGTLKHPGSLPCVVDGFNEKWPVLLEMLKAEMAPGRNTEEAAFGSDEVRSYLLKNAEALRKAGFLDFASQMEDIAEGPLDDLGGIEQRLGMLEQKTVETLRTRQSEEDALAARKSLDNQLRPYGSKMTADQLAVLERQYLDRDLLEEAKIPRLSLFYS